MLTISWVELREDKAPREIRRNAKLDGEPYWAENEEAEMNDINPS
jgi:hypothetical protein